MDGNGISAGTKKGQGLWPCPFPRSEGILSGLAVIIGLEPAAPVIGHSIAFRRLACLRCLFQRGGKRRDLGSLGLPLSGTLSFPSRLRHAGYHLNRIHFEIALNSNSVCSVNPSLDVYFNSVSFL